MPGEGKKWDTNAELNLCVAIIKANQDDNSKMRIEWLAVHDTMERLGYNFTKDAISQHFTKTVMKDFKKRCGEIAKSSTPRSAAKPAATKRRAKAVAAEDDHEDDDVEEKPKPKKVKTEKTKVKKAESPVKEEDDKDRFRRARSYTIPDNEASFEQWFDDGNL